jgi:hypothetical protein
MATSVVLRLRILFLVCFVFVSAERVAAFEVRAFGPVAAAVGETVTLEGSGFTGATAVTFNGNAAVFRVVSDQKITARVPMGSLEGLIEVWKEDASATLPRNFQLEVESSTVVAWGGQSHQWGMNQTAVPADLTNAVAIAAGMTVSLAITGEKELVMWGQFTNLPPAVRTNRFTTVAAGGSLILAVDTGGRLRSHFLDLGGYAYKPFPAAATNIIAVTPHLALRRDGTVFLLATEATPMQGGRVLAMPPATAILGSWWGGLALHRNGRCTYWSESLAMTTLPVTNVVAIGHGTQQELVMLTQSGELYGWNPVFNTLNRFGTDVALAGGNYDFALAVLENGTVINYGMGPYGQTPLPRILENVAALSFGQAHVLALTRLAPKIILQPVDSEGLLGATLRLKAEVVGDRPMSFQWFRNGAWIAGATNIDLTLENLSDADEGEYQLMAWNHRGVVFSDGASVNVVDDFTAFGFSRPQLPGSKVMIFGRGLNHATAVTFNGNSAAFQVLDENRLEAVVPNAIVNGKVRVWVNGAFSEIPETYVAPDDPQLLITWGFYKGYVIDPTQPLLESVVAVTVRDEHGLALRDDGTVVQWKVGLSNSVARGSAEATNIMAVSRGIRHSLALREDGTVLGWGTPDATPPSDLKGVIGIAAGAEHSLALLEDGTVRGWGNNSEKAAEPPPWLREVVKLVANDCSIAIRRDGTAVIWGGQYTTPKIVRAASPIVDAVSQFVNVFLCADGSTILEYPNARTPSILPPAPVPLKAMAVVDFSNGVGVRLDGTLIAWPRPELTLGMVPAISNITALAASPIHVAVLARQTPIIVRQPHDVYLATGASGTLSADVRFGSVYRWFKDGKLHSTNATLSIPAMSAADVGTYVLRVSNVVGEVASSAVREQFLARPTIASFAPAKAAVGETVRINGTNLDKVTAVTFNGNGALFRVINSSAIDAIVPNAWAKGPVSVFVDEYRVESTSSFDMAATVGSLVAWGGEYWGPLWFDPAQVTIPAGATNPVLVTLQEDFNSVRLGSGDTVVWGRIPPTRKVDHAVAYSGTWERIVAMRADGSLWRSASNVPDTSFVPTDVTDAVNIAAGPRRVLRRNGTLHSAGPGALPAALAALTNVTGIAASYNNWAAVVRSDGLVTVWQTEYPILGNIPGAATNVVAVAGGFYHIVALRRDGTVVAWGHNDYGQTDVPAGLANVIQIAAGGLHSFALTADGKIVTWGSNNNKQRELPTLGHVMAISSSPVHGVATVRAPQVLAPLRLKSVDFDLNGGQIFLSGSRENSSDLLNAATLRIYASEAVTGPWTSLEGEVGVVAGGLSFRFDGAFTNEARFFRVVETTGE